MHHYLSNEKDSVRKNNFFLFPIGAYSPEMGLEYGVTGIFSFYTDKFDRQTRVSTLNFLVTHTTKNQTGVKAIADIWSKQNKYHYYTEFRYRNYPYDFYGIGNNTSSENKDEVDEKRAKLILAADKKVAKNFYVGLRAGYEDYTYRDLTVGGILTTDNYYGASGGKQIYFGAGQMFDSRNNVTYTTKGLYEYLSFNYTPDLFGGQNFHGTFSNFDARYFIPVSRRVTLGLNSIYQGVYSENIPFYLYPQLGSSTIMRGYYQGRFRDKNLAAAQTELRYRFVPRFAVVAFGGYGSVWGQDNISFHSLKPNYGAGIRYFFDLAKDLTLRLDYGLGQKLPNGKRFSGYYFSMSEAF